MRCLATCPSFNQRTRASIGRRVTWRWPAGVWLAAAPHGLPQCDLKVTCTPHQRTARRYYYYYFSVLLANARFTAIELHALLLLYHVHIIYYVLMPAALNLLQDVLHDYVHAVIRDWIVSKHFLWMAFSGLSTPLFYQELKRF